MSEVASSLQIEVGSSTDIGCVRRKNEDSYRVASALDLFVVSDGMGGGGSGEVASAMAVETMVAYCHKASADASAPYVVMPRPGLSERTNRLADLRPLIPSLLAAIEATPSGAASQFLIGAVTSTSLSTKPVTFPEGGLTGVFGGDYGIFGAGNFVAVGGGLGPGGVLGQAVVPGTTLGYVVAANGQPLSAINGGNVG